MVKTIASAIANSRLSVFDDLIAKHFDDIDLSPIMVYLVDCVDSSALPWLAKQFDVDGFRGFDQCYTEAQQRNLIKNAIELHRHIGTIYAIRKACSLIGFTPQLIEENVPVVANGDPVWCAFRILLSPDDISTFDANTLSMLRQYIDYYKRAISILTEIYFGVEILEDKIFSNLEEERDVLTLTSVIDTEGDFSDDFNYDFNI
jgi:phage tail P2-like protein